MPLDVRGLAVPLPDPGASLGAPLWVRVTLELGAKKVPLVDVRDGSGAVLAGVIGFDDPEVGLDLIDTPGVAGSTVAGLKVPGRRIFLPIVIDRRTSGGGTGWQAARAELGQVVNPWVGPTTIVVDVLDPADPTWSTVLSSRQIDAWPVLSPTAWDRATWFSDGLQYLGLEFFAESPMFRQPGGLDVPWDAGGHTTIFLDGLPAGPGLLPQLSNSTQIGDPSQVVAGGDVDTPGVWTITGAKHLVTARHEDSGRSWSIDLTGVTQDVTITTDPMTAAVVDADGTNLWDRWVADPDLWPITCGTQTITVSVTASDSSTSVRLTGDTQWRRAL